MTKSFAKSSNNGRGVRCGGQCGPMPTGKKCAVGVMGTMMPIDAWEIAGWGYAGSYGKQRRCMMKRII